MFDALASFVAIAEAGNLTKAAKRSGIPSSTLSRQLAQLEQRLGLRLFQRSTRAMRLTAEGEQLYRRATAPLQQLDQALTDAATQEKEPEGLLRLTAPASFGRLLVAPLIAAYMARYPKVEVEALLVDRRVNLIEEGFDLAYRMGTLEDSMLIGRRVGAAVGMLCASPDYLARHGMPQAPAELAGHSLLSLTREQQSLTLQHQDGSKQTVLLRPRLRCSPPDALLPPLFAGVGIALIPYFLVHDALQQGQLRPVLPAWQLPQQAIHLLYPSKEGMPRKLSAFIDMAMAQLAGDRRFSPGL